MRDRAQMITILEGMRDNAQGIMVIPGPFGLDPDEQKTVHHVQLLEDEGLVEIESESMARITSDGYDFLEEMERGPDYRKKIIGWSGAGKTLVDTLNAVMTAAGHIS